MASLAVAGTAAFTRSSSSYYGGMHCRACMIKTDHYSILGVRRNASKTEIKRAYRRLVRQYHPDVCKDRASEQKFVQINGAYESIIKKESCFQSEIGMDYSVDDLFQMEVVPDIFYTNEWFEGLDFNNILYPHYTMVRESMDEKIFTAENEGCQTTRSEDAIPWMQ